MSRDEQSYLLFRVDDRLLHGQVSLGWGSHLQPRAYLLADDELAGDEGSRALFSLAAPAGVEVTVVGLEQVPVHPSSDATVLLVRTVVAAAALLRNGVRGPVNLGGLHRHPGAEPYLPFLFLDADERALLRELAADGHELFVQDLPGNPTHDIIALLDDGPDPERV